METMKAFWRYDWTLNRVRYLALVAVAVAWPWAMESSQAAFNTGASWVVFILPLAGMSFLLMPLLQVSALIELGRAGSPREARDFVHTLPVDRSAWALAKLVGALAGTVLLPTAALILGVFTAKYAFGTYSGIARAFVMFLAVVSVGAIWTLLWAALLPHRWVLIGIPAFLCGEWAVRGTNSEAWASVVVGMHWETSVDLSLLAVLATLLAIVFVRYHRNRRQVQSLLLALGALVTVDAARAWLWW